ncbi:Ribonuclease 2 [Linum grandiflorum]
MSVKFFRPNQQLTMPCKHATSTECIVTLIHFNPNYFKTNRTESISTSSTCSCAPIHPPLPISHRSLHPPQCPRPQRTTSFTVHKFNNNNNWLCCSCFLPPIEAADLSLQSPAMSSSVPVKTPLLLLLLLISIQLSLSLSLPRSFSATIAQLNEKENDVELAELQMVANSNAREFDYFKLALQGENSPTEFTIHGLWADYNDGSWPSCCGGSNFNEKEVRS